tara:strand:+ start:1226 stop:1663 length:438 start_codon:yes stop_codon:yes gene_type:complete
MKGSKKILLSIFLFLLFFIIRGYETSFFYDPLIAYFKNDYLYKYVENIDLWRLTLNMLFRYLLNSIISLGLIWVLFERKDYFKFSFFFFVFAIIPLILVFNFLIKDGFEGGYLLPYYIRRFIIHPLFLLLLLPAFYYQKFVEKLI